MMYANVSGSIAENLAEKMQQYGRKDGAHVEVKRMMEGFERITGLPYRNRHSPPHSC
jgi:hypothetical protein